jgi:hypothetical protein
VRSTSFAPEPSGRERELPYATLLLAIEDFAVAGITNLHGS